MGATTWHGRRLMRISVSSWRTTDADVDRSVQAIVAAWQADPRQDPPPNVDSGRQWPAVLLPKNRVRPATIKETRGGDENDDADKVPTGSHRSGASRSADLDRLTICGGGFADWFRHSPSGPAGARIGSKTSSRRARGSQGARSTVADRDRRGGRGARAARQLGPRRLHQRSDGQVLFFVRPLSRRGILRRPLRTAAFHHQ